MEFFINTSSRQPIYQQLGKQIREAIARGDLLPETKLPSVRELSRDLVVNPNTIARAYTELEREGFVTTRPGLGVFVERPRPELTRVARERQLLEMLDQFLTAAVHLGFSAEEVHAYFQRRSKQFEWKPIKSK